MSRLSSSTLRVGDSSPPLVLPTRDGELVDLAALLDIGAVLLIFVPGTWSPNSRRQLEAVERAHDQFRSIGVLPVVVATQDQGRLTKALMHSSPSFLILSDETRDAARDYGVYRAISWDGIGVTCPSVFLIDREAKVRFIYAGERDADVPDVETILSLATWLVGAPPPGEVVPTAEAEDPVAAQETVSLPEVEPEAVSVEEEEQLSESQGEDAGRPAEAATRETPTGTDEPTAEAAPEVPAAEVAFDVPPAETHFEAERPAQENDGDPAEAPAHLAAPEERPDSAPTGHPPGTNGSTAPTGASGSSVGAAAPDVRSS